ncbi:MAG: T9SS type A sorting domain-containing protein, partial [Bacteroidetes bacterium]|nr:T9SS type A sorting domain-containing protein [Bacteroidota bacterium]
TVTISGSGYDGATLSNNIVKFNGVAATVSASTSTTLTVTVPSGALSGPLTVSVGGQTATGNPNFIVPAFQFITPQFPSTISTDGALAATISVSVPIQVSNPSFIYYGLSSGASSAKTLSVSLSGSTLSASVSQNDPIGLGYYFQATDLSTGVLVKSQTGRAYLSYTSANSPSLPNLVFGTSQRDYQIIATPIRYADSTVATVMKSLGAYNNTQWRLFDYAGGANEEYPGFNYIVPGKGYWLIIRNQVTINPGAGTAVHNDETKPFPINLKQGWNLIGNPYNFRISWNDVLTFNSSPSSVGSLKTFSNGTLAANTILNAWQGGFVYAQTPVTIYVSPLRNASLGGRVAYQNVISGSESSGNWQVNLAISSNGLTNEVGGLGMDENASDSKLGRADEPAMNFPKGLSIPQILFDQKKEGMNLTKFIAANHTSYTWAFSTDAAGELRWDASAFAGSAQGLVLVDLNQKISVDMLRVSSYDFSGGGKFKIYYGNERYISTQLDEVLPILGDPYPNPSNGIIKLPLRVSAETGSTSIQATLFDMEGKQVLNWNSEEVFTGSHVMEIDSHLPAGLYIMKLNTHQGDMKVVKVIIN